MKGTASSGDNSIEAFAEISDITDGAGNMGYGDVYIKVPIRLDCERLEIWPV